MSTAPVYFICKYCRDVFQNVSLLKSHTKAKHQDPTRKVVTLNHLPQDQVKIEVEHDNDGTSDIMTFYECPECPAHIVDPLKFFMHLDDHSLKPPKSTQSSELFHTADGRVMTIHELSSNGEIFIPKIKLTSWTEVCAQYSKLVPPPDLKTLVRSDSKNTEVVATKLNMKLQSRTGVQKIKIEDDLSEELNDETYLNVPMADLGTSLPTPPSLPISSTGTSKLVCGIHGCANSYSDRSALSVHKRGKHFGITYPCPICHHPFTALTNLIKHRKKYH